MSRILKYLILSIAFILQANAISQENIEFKGVSLSSANKETSESDIQSIKSINANYVSIVPYAFLKDNAVIFDSKYQWEGERPEAVKKSIQLAHKNGLKVMLKPHVWIGHEGYTGDYVCKNDKEWEKFETSYRDYIMTFVSIAEEEHVEIFTIGTEFGGCVENRPKFWRSLIKDIREVYSGKLVYAANWDDYQKVPFWNDLDYIGIDSYFPLSIGPNPNLSELLKSWKTIMPILEQYASLSNKKILFTEFGFKSTTDATVSPWKHDSTSPNSEKIQDLAFKSCFQTIWKKSWFKGGFIWKWYHDHKNAGGRGDTDFTPQNKLAEETIRKFYGE